VGSDVVCGPIEAALANGVLAQADETDDSHAPSLSHPGCAVVPAAFAAAEELGLDGSHFLRTVALGYDIGSRVTMCLGIPDLSRDLHKSTHSIAGVFGAAAAAGCAAGSTPSTCAGCLTTPRSNPPASPPGSATPITSRRRSCSAACRRAAG
jgi:2-methylcitrate dehydratase PrpD